ncbi:aspartyl protease family protein [Novosphingobium sp. SL115]|uniref:aspartyl protease family protein n=1 Tax=Novosphingobium sp. SL115 TaxID=2995150 RepID=UPI00227270D3|nr:aspartyl protease family protein [Novosphingobium sp. SL115]MCY1669685.1 aspartyl protease family protein [Novosphingobium sp. SL115]
MPNNRAPWAMHAIRLCMTGYCAVLSCDPLMAQSAPTPALALAPVITQPAITQPSNAELVKLTQDRYDRYTVPVHIGTTGPFRFLIDTGAERTILSHDVAARLGLSASGNATIVGVAGAHSVQIVEVEELSIGRRTFYGLSAPLLESAHIGADGIVGVDSLQDQRVLIDFVGDRIAIGDAANLGGARGFEIVVSARRKSGQLIMANARVDGIATSIIIHTGSDTSIGNPALQKALSRRSPTQATTLISVTGQSIGAEMATASVIEVEGIRLHNTPLAFADALAFRRLGLDRKPAMLMGMGQLRMFSRVAIDFSTRRILFDLPAGVAGPRP